MIDRPAARWLALLVLLLCAASLGYLHRDDLWPNAVATAVEQDPAAPCIRQRFAEIEALVAEGTVEAAEAELFRQRAAAMCRATAGDRDPGPGLPVD